MASEQAEEILRRAKVKAKAINKRAAQRAERLKAHAKEMEKEMLADARSEVVSTKRKVVRAEKLVKKTSSLFTQAQGQAWGTMSDTQRLQEAADRVAATVAADKAKLSQVNHEIEMLSV